MASDLIHRISIAAPAESMYRALTTEEGIKGWWTTDVKMDAHAGRAISLEDLPPKKIEENPEFYIGRPRECGLRRALPTSDPP